MRAVGVTAGNPVNWNRYQRVQATLFLPDETAARIDEMRGEWDPVMTARIRPHVTVLRRVPDAAGVLSTLRATDVRECRLHIGAPARAPRHEGGTIYLPVSDPHGDLAQLWSALQACSDEAGTIQARPHVTVVHPRTVEAERIDRGWAALRGWSVSEHVVISEIALIGETPERWETIETVQLVRSA